MHQHKTILIALNVIEKMWQDVQNNNKETDYKDIEDIIGFLKTHG
jgi:hemerythrin-like domain-containing protein